MIAHAMPSALKSTSFFILKAGVRTKITDMTFPITHSTQQLQYDNIPMQATPEARALQEKLVVQEAQVLACCHLAFTSFH